jgi:hypothetical protein
LTVVSTKKDHIRIPLLELAPGNFGVGTPVMSGYIQTAGFGNNVTKILKRETFATMGYILCQLDKASVFPFDKLEEVKAHAKIMSERGFRYLMHYKEIALFGAYGLKRSDMSAAVDLIGQNPIPFEKLIEKRILPQQIPDLLPDVLAGKSLKYVIDFTGRRSEVENTALSLA